MAKKGLKLVECVLLIQMSGPRMWVVKKELPFKRVPEQKTSCV